MIEHLESIPLEDYIRWKKNIVAKAMKDAVVDGINYEYYKGQFLVLRELLEPKYRSTT